MKKLMMRYFMVNCKEATYLMGKKEEGKLSIVERVKLSMHTSMCVFCKKFEKQTNKIAEESIHIRADEDLPLQAKEKIQQMIEEHL
ncbi:MAG: hypothetical protein Q8R50_09990 [Sediminibacterium sp.]|nr:hypothetical protein [Sediminibacterium sp.]